MAFLIMRMPQHALIKDDNGGSVIYTKRMTRLKSLPHSKLKTKRDVFGFQKLPPVRSKKGKIVDNAAVLYNIWSTGSVRLITPVLCVPCAHLSPDSVFCQLSFFHRLRDIAMEMIYLIA